jgi:hypothetical protein
MAKVGRKKCSARLYAEEIGVTFRRLRLLGGEARLRAMSDDARAVMLKPGCVRAVVSQAERVA